MCKLVFTVDLHVHVSVDNLADIVHPDQNYWNKKNNMELKKALQPPNTGVAKNLVLAIGDGMGVTTTTGERSQIQLYHRYERLTETITLLKIWNRGSISSANFKILRNCMTRSPTSSPHLHWYLLVGSQSCLIVQIEKTTQHLRITK